MPGRPPDKRQGERETGAKLDAFRQWLDVTSAKLSRRSDLSIAVRHARTHWPALTRYADDDQLQIDDNAAECALRGVAVGRKNGPFAGSDQSRHRAASIYGLVENSRFDGADPEVWLIDTIHRVAGQPECRISDAASQEASNNPA